MTTSLSEEAFKLELASRRSVDSLRWLWSVCELSLFVQSVSRCTIGTGSWMQHFVLRIAIF